MTLKEKKRKLSEILGLNLFESRYKEIDAVLGTDEDTEPETAEETKAEETAAEETKTEDAEESKDGDKTEETEAETTAEGEDKEETAEGDVTEEKESETEDDGETADGGEPEQEAGDDNAASDGAEEQGEGSSDMEAELFDAKLEAKLLRAGVREDKLDAAKKLFKADHTLADIEKVEKWVKEYPEWTKQKVKEQAKGFGMGVGDNDSSETAEDKRLRELGII